MINWPPKSDEPRPERIQELKARIERGEYQVPSERVADAIISWYQRADPFSRR